MLSVSGAEALDCRVAARELRCILIVRTVIQANHGSTPKARPRPAETVAGARFSFGRVLAHFADSRRSRHRGFVDLGLLRLLLFGSYLSGCGSSALSPPLTVFHAPFPHFAHGGKLSTEPTSI